MSIKAISPVDGRYQRQTVILSDYFSEYALIKYRVYIEVQYFKALQKEVLQHLPQDFGPLDQILEKWNDTDALRVKEIEQTTNHDVKAVEYFIKEKLTGTTFEPHLEFIHFGLTSQDINNTAFPLMIKDAITNVLMPELMSVIETIKEHTTRYKGISMLAKTHGQPASPTTMGKEWQVWVERLENQISEYNLLTHRAKFGGATGNLNAHKVTYPNLDWQRFADAFVGSLGLVRSKTTTQIAHYDELASICQSFIRTNTILIDFCRDIWTYISMDYFKQKTIANEVGSSAMPHKVNPIDFENAEGNLGFSTAILDHLSLKLPISRLQRDLTDSTVMRNIGVPFAHTLIAYKSILKGCSKLTINLSAIDADLNSNWAVVAEGIQNVLRREGYPKPYEALKALTRGTEGITEDTIAAFIQGLDVSDALKSELANITPHNYVGYY